MQGWQRFILYGIFLVYFPLVSGAAANCGAQAKVVLQVLGSGGPIADDARAGSGYLVWVDGKARVLVDIGSGSWLRFAGSGASIADLRLIALTHFHTDHAGDLPALLKSTYFTERKIPLRIAGPSGNHLFPSLIEFFKALFDAKQGAFRYLSSIPVLPLMVADTQKSVSVYSAPDLQVEALYVPHGPVPTLAYRIRVGGKRIVFASDQNGSNPRFIDFSRQADLLVMPLAIGQKSDKIAKRLHMTPHRLGEITRDAAVKRLLLSHFMQRSLLRLPKNVLLIKKLYKGPLYLAQDLACFPL